MPGITRMTDDSAGGVLIAGSDNVFVNKKGAVRIGDAVAGHGNSPHDSPVMAAGSGSVFVNGIPKIPKNQTLHFQVVVLLKSQNQ